MYSQFCYYIQQDESKRHATMHINRKPVEQVEVDWAWDPAKLTDPDAGEIVNAYIFVGVMTYSQYAYVEAFPDEKQRSWIDAHIHMYEYLSSIAKILVPDNCKTAMIHNKAWKEQQINDVYHEMAEWKQATVQFNYHISVDGMQYSIPYEYIGKKVDARVTGSVIEIFYNQNRIASHKRLYGRKGQYSTVTEHMPKDHQEYLKWNGDRFRKWAERIGTNTYEVIDEILLSKRVEQQSYRSCMGLLNLSEKYSPAQLEEACRTALSYTGTPSYKSVSNLLTAVKDSESAPETTQTPATSHSITRGAAYYRRNRS